ncbi:MAG: hypothetical protein Q4G52_02790 [Clostridia bacterium]|nr:hypothetical protein [Clostridia bacterium]
MLDEWFDGVVDRLCVSVPRKARVYRTYLMGFSLFWRIGLYLSALGGMIAGAFGRISDEDKAEDLMKEALERGEDQFLRLRRASEWRFGLMAYLNEGVRRARLGALLALLMLSALAVLGTGSRSAAACALSTCLFFLAAGMEDDYAPVCGGVRQRYLAAMLLRAAGMGALLADSFRSYAVRDLASNVVLQSAMIVALTVHAALFLSLTAFERRQPLFLRALSGVLGVMSALMAASSVALAASTLGQGPERFALGVLGAMGALLLFLSEETGTFTQVGSIRLRYAELWRHGFFLAGLALTLAAAWGA